MEGFDHILNWKLKAGSHQFPGKDGGTCINEAALVAAGFEYQPIRRVEDMPACFSRPICRFAMWLNDNASDENRHLLLPFVTRLACADTWEVEREREVYIQLRMARGGLDIKKGVEILEGALAIGRHAEPFMPDIIRARMDAVRETAASDTSVADAPLFGKIKDWFGAKKVAASAD